MNIFSDFHHSGLAYSLALTFEKRLGATVYFPIGERWFSEGFWNIARPYGDSPATIAQYLSLDSRYAPIDGTPLLTDIQKSSSTHYEIWDHAHEYMRKAITFDQFMDMDIDIIIASIPDHSYAYTKLRDRYKPQAKVIFQMGNMFNEVHALMQQGVIKNLLSSTIEIATPSSVNACFYYQEINTDVFQYSDPTSPVDKISSFVNCLPNPRLYAAYKTLLPEYEFRAFGSSCPNGSIQTIKEIAQLMRQSHFGYHVKPAGDGFGHVWHNWALIGRPIITNFSDYQHTLAGALFEDGVTGIDLQKRTMEQNVDFIKELSHPERHRALCYNMHERAKSLIDYNAQAQKIQHFLSQLQ